MYGKINVSKNLLGSFQMSSVAMRYNEFVARAYNLSKSLGFTPVKSCRRVRFVLMKAKATRLF